MESAEVKHWYRDFAMRDFMAEVIGQTNSGNDRLLYSGGCARYLERPAEDELHQLLKE